jgi:hypothetical protein
LHHHRLCILLVGLLAGLGPASIVSAAGAGGSAVEALAAWLEERARITDAIPAAEPASEDSAAATWRW